MRFAVRAGFRQSRRRASLRFLNLNSRRLPKIRPEAQNVRSHRYRTFSLRRSSPGPPDIRIRRFRAPDDSLLSRVVEDFRFLHAAAIRWWSATARFCPSFEPEWTNSAKLRWCDLSPHRSQRVPNHVPIRREPFAIPGTGQKLVVALMQQIAQTAAHARHDVRRAAPVP